MNEETNILLQKILDELVKLNKRMDISEEKQKQAKEEGDKLTKNLLDMAGKTFGNVDMSSILSGVKE